MIELDESKHVARRLKRALLNIALVLGVAALLFCASPAVAEADAPSWHDGQQAQQEQARLYAIPKTADYALPTIAVAGGVAAGGLVFLAYRSRKK